LGRPALVAYDKGFGGWLLRLKAAASTQIARKISGTTNWETISTSISSFRVPKSLDSGPPHQDNQFSLKKP
jgi:hypothetical protein